MRKVMVLNGPNLNLLGSREPDIYGIDTLAQILRRVRREARRLGIRVRAYQSNHEGRLIDRVQALRRRGYSGLVINPGALTHYSYALRDAVAAAGVPAVEVHLSDIERREPFRRVSVIRDVCAAQIKGLGPRGYTRALEVLAGMWEGKD
ncbi:MAG: type II 3-dehydroquinate dehydratase [Spirochaetota bacterium]